MSLKSFTKTRWKIDADRVVLYPYGSSIFFGLFLTVVFVALSAYIFKNEYNRRELGPVLELFAVILLYFYANAATHIEFNNRTKRMQKRLFGIIPVVSTPFEELQGINPVTNTMGGYNYRAFKKSNRYGKGVAVSSGYTKNDDPNAIAFVSGPVPLIHSYLTAGQMPETNVRVPITSFRFFNEKDGVFFLKKNKAALIVLGILLCAFGIWAGLNLKDDDAHPNMNIVTAVIFILLGLIFVFGAFSKLSFDTRQKLLMRTGLAKKQYHFANFTGFRTVRRTTNFVYSGTELQMFFRDPNTQKETPIQVMSFRSTKYIDLFIAEVNQIMGI